jgi:putative DNA primase/helicase
VQKIIHVQKIIVPHTFDFGLGITFRRVVGIFKAEFLNASLLVLGFIGHFAPHTIKDRTSLLSGRPAPAKAGVRETWGSCEAAALCAGRGLARGIGYEFDGGGIYGVDLDHVIDTGETLTQEAREIVDLLNSYTEVSPSGSGLHLFVFAEGADITRHRKKDGFVEIYTEGRYFTVTGNAYGGVKPIETRTAELQAVHDRFLLPSPAQRPVCPSPPIAGQTRNDASHFLNIGLERDGVFLALWNGERRCGNESGDDQALMNKLAYWCSADTDAMIRAFLSSPHYDRKDEAHKRKCQRTDYLPNTARKAAATVYSTATFDYERWQQTRKRGRSYAR